MMNFFTFRLMVSSVIIKILFVVGLISITAYGFYEIFNGSIWYGLSMIFVGNLIWRLLCEGAIAVFSIHDVLVSIERKVYEERPHMNNNPNRDLFK